MTCEVDGWFFVAGVGGFEVGPINLQSLETGGGGLNTFNCIQTHACVQSGEKKKGSGGGGGSGVPLQKRNYKNEVGLRSVKPSGVIYCTLKARSGIYSGSGGFPCKACRLDP